MPVLKVPVVHKFGIISHYQKLELQARLLSDFSSSKVNPVPTNSLTRLNLYFRIFNSETCL